MTPGNSRFGALGLFVAAWLLTPVAAVAQEAGVTTPVVVRAENAPATEDGVTWVFINSESEEVISADGGARLAIELPPGTYEVVLTAEGFEGEATIEVAADAANEFSVPVSMQGDGFGFMAPESIPAGHLLRFEFRGPNLEGDRIFVARLDMDENRYFRDNDLAHKAGEGSPAEIVAPRSPGEYELRYFSMANGAVLFREPITVTDPDIRWRVPVEIVAATLFTFEFSGPALADDRLFIAPRDMDENRYYTDADISHKAADGFTATLIAPVAAGEYEIRYFSGAAGGVLGRYPLVVSDHTVMLDAPRTVAAGTAFDIEWAGPEVEGDFLFLTEPSLAETAFYSGNRRRYVTDGSPASFTAPAEPGPYEVRYYSAKNGRMVAKRTIVVR